LFSLFVVACPLVVVDGMSCQPRGDQRELTAICVWPCLSWCVKFVYFADFLYFSSCSVRYLMDVLTVGKSEEITDIWIRSVFGVSKARVHRPVFGALMPMLHFRVAQ